TENPFFSVNSALISRSSVFGFEPISEEAIFILLRKAIEDSTRGLAKYDIKADEDALRFLCVMCNGDARKALNALEVGVLSQASRSSDSTVKFDLAIAKESIQQKTINYDNKDDSHYDLASALQKSMRGSDPDAAVYWLARLIAGGEDPRFIARRICVCAAEDVGNADPMATVLAASAMQISEFVGFPEAQLPLAQAAIYIACAPKSNASSMAIWTAVSDVKNNTFVPVPKDLKDNHYFSAKKAGIGAGYKYPHSYGGFVVQQYMPKEAKKEYYTPKNAGYEKNINRYLQNLKSLIQSNSTVDFDGKGNLDE
ncbi:MAG TPA: replication-associated recombination protein A, partial [Sedimentisphaerales bacterium]|nr:replication-associated recombination protein A [Sedimentisphaerales bacterium]